MPYMFFAAGAGHRSAHRHSGEVSSSPGGQRQRRFAAWVLLPLVVMLAGCSAPATNVTSPTTVPIVTNPQPATDNGSLRTIAVTYSVLASLVTPLVGDLATVVSVIPDGEDPHSYQPTDAEVQLIADADFVVANGLHFETGLDPALESARRNGKPIFYAIDYVTARLAGADDHSHADDDDHDHGDIDLHLWLSPPTMRQMIPELSRQLGEFLESNLDAASQRLLDELDALDTEILDKMSTVENCAILVNHDEFGYFAERYGCTSETVFVPTSADEVSNASSAATREAARRAAVSTVIVNRSISPELLGQISAAVGVRVVAIPTHTMGASTTYVQFMRSLVDSLVAALTS